MKVGLGNFWNVVVKLLKGQKGLPVRLHPQVGLACSSLFLVLEMWLMLSKIVDHVGREYGCEI